MKNPIVDLDCFFSNFEKSDEYAELTFLQYKDKAALIRPIIAAMQACAAQDKRSMEVELRKAIEALAVMLIGDEFSTHKQFIYPPSMR
jgi:hypothetical protein